MKIVNKIIVIGLLLLTGCLETIVHDISEGEANRLLAGLHDAGFLVEKERQADGKWSLLVDKSQSVQAIKFLDARRLLVSAPKEANNNSSMLRDREESRFRFERSLSHELEYTIAAISGVTDVRVHLNLPERDPLLGRKIDLQSSGTGSVLLVVRDQSNIDIEQIKNLVAGAGGINVQNINVLISQAAANDVVVNDISSLNTANLAIPGTELNYVEHDQPENIMFNWYQYRYWHSYAAACVFVLLFFVYQRKRKLCKLNNLFDAQSV